MTAPADPAPLDTADPDDGGAACRLQLPGWDGSLDLLLAQARAQRIDLAQVPVSELLVQLEARLLAAITGNTVPLPQLAGWLVTAATLLALRARLLVPDMPGEDAAAAQGAAVLQQALLERAVMQRAATWLEQRQQLGRDVFARGAPEPLADAPPATDLTELLRACLGLLEAPVRGRQVYRPSPPPLWRVPEALAHLRRLLPGLAGEGTTLLDLVPPEGDSGSTPLQHRAALASTLLAGLELSRDGALALDQQDAFGPIQVEPAGQQTTVPPGAAITMADRVR